jgi:hypothetical protein
MGGFLLAVEQMECNLLPVLEAIPDTAVTALLDRSLPETNPGHKRHRHQLRQLTDRLRSLPHSPQSLRRTPFLARDQKLLKKWESRKVKTRAIV